MPKIGTKIFCPKCKVFRVCRSIPPTTVGKPKAQRWYRTDHKDIGWFRRARKCHLCETNFLTAEIDEKLLDELIKLRELLAKKNRALISRKNLARNLPLHQNDVPIDVARGFIERTAWWLTHSSGMPVRAPRHSRRIYLSPHHGWSIDFGANSFLISKAISRSNTEIANYFERVKNGEIPQLEELRQKLMLHMRGSVGNYGGAEYEGYYSVSGSDMVFGAQSIDIKDGSNFLIEISGIKDFLAET